MKKIPRVLLNTRAEIALSGPAAAERAVNRDTVHQLSRAVLQEVLLRNIKILLREENIHVVIDSLPVARVCQVKPPLLRFDEKRLRGDSRFKRIPRRQRIRHFAKGDLNGALVIGHFDLLLQLRNIQVRLVSPSLENG